MQKKKNITLWQSLFISPALFNKKRSHVIAYIAVLSALNVIVNTFSVTLGIVQYSLTLFMAAVTGILLGGAFGFISAFIGDAVGFFIGGVGAFTPWIGISMGMTAWIAGAVYHVFDSSNENDKRLWRLLVIAILSFLVSTLAINTTAGFYLWNKNALPFWQYFNLRFFILGQVWNSIFNYALLFVIVPKLKKVKLM